jgi:hypothetical protein
MLMPFGKHRGVEVEKLPENYVKWLWTNIDLREPLLSEVERVIYGLPKASPAPSSEHIKEVYHDMAMKWHPDRGGSVEAMQAVNDFYERLKVRH